MGRENSRSKKRTAAQGHSHEGSDGGADTGQRELPEEPIKRRTPRRKGSVVEDLMRRRILPEGVNHTSDREKLDTGVKGTRTGKLPHAKEPKESEGTGSPK